MTATGPGPIDPHAFDTYADNVFAEAISVGCYPSLVGPPFNPMWRCDCPGRMHAVGTSSGLLTDVNLRRFKVLEDRIS